MNVTNLRMNNVIINGTYSQERKYGYGISMNNVWNARFKRLRAHGKWGVFGNNNVNHTVIEDSDINRFDIHCYGRDVFCYRTTFRNIYNQFSSLYGQLVFDGCVFINFVPVLFEDTYSAYTPFELVIKNSTIAVRADRPCLVAAGYAVDPPEGARRELCETSWPNVTIDNVEVVLPPGQKDWLVFKINSEPTVKVKNISQIKVNGLKILTTESEGSVKFSNYPIQTEEEVKYIMMGSSKAKMVF